MDDGYGKEPALLQVLGADAPWLASDSPLEADIMLASREQPPAGTSSMSGSPSTRLLLLLAVAASPCLADEQSVT